MKEICTTCHGKGYIHAQRVEDSYECCNGAIYYCNVCEDEIPIDEVEDEDDEVHLCLEHRIQSYE